MKTKPTQKLSDAAKKFMLLANEEGFEARISLEMQTDSRARDTGLNYPWITWRKMDTSAPVKPMKVKPTKK